MKQAGGGFTVNTNKSRQKQPQQQLGMPIRDVIHARRVVGDSIVWEAYGEEGWPQFIHKRSHPRISSDWGDQKRRGTPQADTSAASIATSQLTTFSSPASKQHSAADLGWSSLTLKAILADDTERSARHCVSCSWGQGNPRLSEQLGLSEGLCQSRGVGVSVSV